MLMNQLPIGCLTHILVVLSARTTVTMGTGDKQFLICWRCHDEIKYDEHGSRYFVEGCNSLSGGLRMMCLPEDVCFKKVARVPTGELLVKRGCMRTDINNTCVQGNIKTTVETETCACDTHLCNESSQTHEPIAVLWLLTSVLALSNILLL